MTEHSMEHLLLEQKSRLGGGSSSEHLMMDLPALKENSMNTVDRPDFTAAELRAFELERRKRIERDGLIRRWPCSFCGALPGQDCRNTAPSPRGWYAASKFHKDRIKLAGVS